VDREDESADINDPAPGPNIFGEFAAIDGAQRSASIEAHRRSRIASLPGATFREILQSHPTVTLALLRRLVTAARATTRQVYELSTLNVSQRVQLELLRLAGRALRQGNSAAIVPAPTHADIASPVTHDGAEPTRLVTSRA
jgi:cAMP-binding proteins - catabolite gene activator and regulatory subunit of cAMP-dependent protein kinases